MIVAGVYARRSEKRHDVAIAVTTLDKVLEHTHVSASSGEAESGQLWELNVRAHEVLRPHDVDVVVLWPPDPPPGGRVRLKPTLATGRAEGAVLAAAGQLGIRSDTISGAGIRAAADGSTDDAVATLCQPLSDVPGDDAVEHAVAAASAWRIRNA